MSALYLIWRDPYMTIGNDTFIHDMLGKAGFINVYADYTRYPEVPVEEMIKINPQYVLLSSEPFPFKQKHIEEIKQFLPDAHVMLVDGEMFSWYGSRMQFAAEYFKPRTGSQQVAQVNFRNLIELDLREDFPSQHRADFVIIAKMGKGAVEKRFLVTTYKSIVREK